MEKEPSSARQVNDCTSGVKQSASWQPVVITRLGEPTTETALEKVTSM
jgi:hypothetical protein